MEKKKEEKVDWSLLTPEAAYKRIIEFAERMRTTYHIPEYELNSDYRFSWDKNSTYHYIGTNITGIHTFIRTSDLSEMNLSRYAFLPQDQPEEI